MSSKKVLLIGWDAADWKVISPLLDRGKMPNLERLIDNGVKGNIATLHPVLSPMLWTSIATGKRPYKHGIYGFYEPTPDGLNVQPMTNLSRKTKAIWNILNQKGYKSNVVGWWPSHPAEPINGVMVSDLFHKSASKSGKPKVAPSNSVHPPELLDEMDELRFGLEEVSMQEIYSFIPQADKVDQVKHPHLATCGKILAECATVHATATQLMETTEWDFMAVYYDAIDHFSHGFMKYHPPRRPHIDEEEFELYKDVVTVAYLFHDMMLGRLLEYADEDTTVILLSDHGFHPDHLRPDFVPLEPAGPAIEHRDLGIFVMSGPSTAKDKLVFGTSLLDITPTVLSLFDLPVGDDMDGRVIHEAFESERHVDSIPSWDHVEGDDGQHPSDLQIDPLEAEEAMKQLVELGYIEELSGDKKKNVKNAIRELNFNLARSYMDAGRFVDAVEIMADVYKENQSEYRIGLQLAMCYKALGYNEQLLDLVDHLATRRTNDAQNSRKKKIEFQKLAQERFEEKKEAGEIEGDELPPINDLLSEAEQKDFAFHNSMAKVRTYYFDFLRGFALSAMGKHNEALPFLERAVNAEPNRPTLLIQMGEVFLKLHRREDALKAFEKAHAIDENNPHVLLGIAQYHFSIKNYEACADFAVQSISKLFMYPLAHYTLGTALIRLKEYKRAAEALKIATSQNPNFAEAYRRLAYIYKNHVKDPAQGLIYSDLAREARDITRAQREKFVGSLPAKNEWIADVDVADEDAISDKPADLLPPLRTKENTKVVKLPKDMDPDESIIVVTGLPRSGTSLMMQMLQQGGCDPLVDGVREADEDNPKGYLELEKIKSLMMSNDWVGDAKGKVIKVVAPLLENLPKEFDYKVVFMYRDVEEVILSQNKMLERNGQKGADLGDEKLKGVLNYQLEMAARLLNDKGIATIRVPYRTALEDPQMIAETVCDFLKLDLDTEKMAAAVDPSLYRNRLEPVPNETKN